MEVGLDASGGSQNAPLLPPFYSESSHGLQWTAKHVDELTSCLACLPRVTSFLSCRQFGFREIWLWATANMKNPLTLMPS